MVSNICDEPAEVQLFNGSNQKSFVNKFVLSFKLSTVGKRLAAYETKGFVEQHNLWSLNVEHPTDITSTVHHSEQSIMLTY